MSHTLAVVCASALFLALPGCVTPGSTRSSTAADPYRMKVTGTTAQVAATLQTGLNEAGVVVMVGQVGEVIRLGGQSKSGKIFCIHVKPGKGKNQDQTVVSIRWDRDPDQKLWQTVVDILQETDANGKTTPDES